MDHSYSPPDQYFCNFLKLVPKPTRGGVSFLNPVPAPPHHLPSLLLLPSKLLKLKINLNLVTKSNPPLPSFVAMKTSENENKYW